MEFRPFEKMPKSASKFGRDGRLDRVDFVVMEKVHGANFCFVCEEGDADEEQPVIRCAKRSGFLSQGESFFGHEHVLERLSSNVGDVWRQVKHELGMESVQMVSVYGELFGGEYPHPDVPRCEDDRVRKVQKEIFYCPHLEFCAFDIAIHSLVDGAPQRDYLDYDICMDIFRRCGLFYAEPLLVGTLHQALNYNVEFPTTIPEKLGLPPISDNHSEGVVIKSLKKISLGETGFKYKRAIVKHKSVRFLEKVLPPSHIKKRYGKRQKDGDVSSELLSLVNGNRLSSVLSKYGRVKRLDKGTHQKLAKLLLEDALDDLHENAAHSALFMALPAKEQEAVREKAMQKCMKCVSDYF